MANRQGFSIGKTGMHLATVALSKLDTGQDRTDLLCVDTSTRMFKFVRWKGLLQEVMVLCDW